MFNISKPKINKEAEQLLEDLLPIQEEETKLGDDVTIYAMPERFRSSHIKVGQAKKTGVIIMAAGIVFLIIISGLFYYFFFYKQPKNQIQSSVTTSTPAIEPIKEPEKIATTTPILPSIDLIATSTASSTIATSTATSTEDIINQPADLSIGIDSDGDELTDKEEKVFGSNSTVFDTDNDGYNDFKEVLNGYNPSGAGALSTNSNLQIYNNKTYKYNLLYPSTWEQTTSGGDDSVVFKAEDGSFIQVITQNNKEKQLIEDWYKQQFNIVDINQNNLIVNEGWSGITSQDGLTVYLVDSNKKYIFIITYNPASSNTLNYPNLFKAMIKSFKIWN
ncbi:MAG: hypothetical protein V1651_00725 [Patescibacteria group bacterium]